MPHYVCTGGCNGVSETAGATCQAADCAKYNHPLTECNCTDGQHKESYEKEGKENKE